MADILKISTPLVDKSPIAPTRQPDPSMPFNLSDVSRVIQTTDPSEILQQNTGFVPREEAPKILADLLKDPSVTVSLMKNIYMLEEVIKLLPANNTPLTEEIEQLFKQLMMSPGDIVDELNRQEQTTTLFKGDLFDMLRALLHQSEAQEKPEVATGIGVLLKALNASLSRQDALFSVSNNLLFIADSLGENSKLADKLFPLIAQLRTPDAATNFTELKDQVLHVLREIENSVLFTPQMEKILPLIVYNLSRFNDNNDFLPEALKFLVNMMDNETDKNSLIQKLEAYLDKYLAPGGAREARAAEQDSKVMDIISKIIGRETESDEIKLMSGDKLEKIVHSLLSSPCNFTPLLHFIVPVEYFDIRAFAEIWIDPNADEEAGQAGGDTASTTHLLIVFDVDSIGRFEAEIYVQEMRIAMNLLCPPAYVEEFQGIATPIRRALSTLGYTFEALNIDRLNQTHSLMDVFTDLPRKRTGIDVKI